MSTLSPYMWAYWGNLFERIYLFFSLHCKFTLLYTKVRKMDLTAVWHGGIAIIGHGAHPCSAAHLTEAHVKVMSSGSMQMDNVCRGVTEPRYLFFYSVKEFLLLITARLCVCVCDLTYALETSCSTKSQGKLCCTVVVRYWQWVIKTIKCWQALPSVAKGEARA